MPFLLCIFFFSPIGLGVWTVTLEGKSGANQQRFFSFSLSVVLPPTLPPCLGELGIIGLLLSHLDLALAVAEEKGELFRQKENQ